MQKFQNLPVVEIKKSLKKISKIGICENIFIQSLFIKTFKHNISNSLNCSFKRQKIHLQNLMNDEKIAAFTALENCTLHTKKYTHELPGW